MGKRRQRADNAKGKQQMELENDAKRRGRKTNQERLETLAASYVLGNSSEVRQEIRGWEKEIQIDPEDNEAEAEILDFITDPGNTRGRLTLFNQTIHTYWIVKCLIAKAI